MESNNINKNTKTDNRPKIIRSYTTEQSEATITMNMNEQNTEYTNNSVNNKRESFRKLKNSNVLNSNKNDNLYSIKTNEEDYIDDENTTNNSSSFQTHQNINSNGNIVKSKRRSLPQVNQFSINSSNDSNTKICACCNMAYSTNNLMSNSNENSFGKCEICLTEICDKCHIITKLASKICILCKACSKLDNDSLVNKKIENIDNGILSSTKQNNSLVTKHDIVQNRIRKNVSIVINSNINYYFFIYI